MPKSKEQFLEVLDQHKGILYKISNAYGKNDDDRKDLIQEMTLQIWRSLDRYDNKHQWSTYIYRIALNVAITFYRRQQKWVRDTSITENILQVPEEVSFGNRHQEELTMLQEFIADLEPLERALMILYLDESSTKNTSEVLGISESNVTSKIYRIKNKLKVRFDQVLNSK